MESSTPVTWTVWRIDDNANTFVVRSGLSKEEAELLAASMEARPQTDVFGYPRRNASARFCP
jgi:hypothetical protein